MLEAEVVLTAERLH